MAEIEERLGDPDCRLLTLVGPGGIGKTRLAVEAASAQTDVFAHGVFFVELAPLQSVDAIVPTVAQALGFSFYEGVEPRQQLLDYLRQKSMLLVMDNFEHLLACRARSAALRDASAKQGRRNGVDLVADILRTAPDVIIVATSRERLNVQGEYLFPVAGMDYPEGTTSREGQPVVSSAVQLFLHSARRVQPDFQPTGVDLAEVGRICRLVEGMPLAILLAAGWVQMLRPKEIAGEIERGIDLLETDVRDVPERHRSMRAVFDHSWNLLSAQQRRVMETLSVFRGGFTLTAAQEVSGATLRELMALVNKSLLQRAPSGQYDVHSLLRDYAAEALQRTGQAASARDAHASYYAAFMQAREVDLKGRRQLAALDEIEADFENVRAAWDWAVDREDYAAIQRSLESLYWFCFMHGRMQEGRDLFQQARERLSPRPGEDPNPVWCRMAVRCLDSDEDTVVCLERCLANARRHSRHAEIADILWGLGMYHRLCRESNKALSFFEESLDHYRAIGDRFQVAMALWLIGSCHLAVGQWNDSLRSYRQSIDLRRQVGDKIGVAYCLSHMGQMAFAAGNYSGAESYLGEANTLFREMGIQVGIDATQSLTVFVRGDLKEAQVLATEAMDIATDINSPGGKGFCLAILGLIDCMQEDYTRGRELCAESRPLLSRFPDLAFLPDWGLSIAACGLGDYCAAKQHSRTALKLAYSFRDPLATIWCLPVAALILAHEGTKERAAELLALAFRHPPGPAGWMKVWPMLARFRAELEVELLPVAVSAAQERGRARDLDQTVKELLIDLEEKQGPDA
jgi:predicted ATPase